MCVCVGEEEIPDRNCNKIPAHERQLEKCNDLPKPAAIKSRSYTSSRKDPR